MSRLQELCAIEYGKALPERVRKPGPVAVYGSAGSVGSHTDALYNEPVIVVGRKGNISGVYKSDGPSWVIDTAYALKPGPQLDRNYLFHFLKFHTSHLAASDQSTAIPSLAREVLYSLELSAPPIEKQRAVASKIDSLFKEVESGTREVKQTKLKLELYKQSVLNAAIRGKLVMQDLKDEPASKLLDRIRSEKDTLINTGKLKKEKPIAPITPDEIPFEVPQHWKWVRLGEIIWIKSGYAFKSEYFRREPGPFILTTPGSFHEKGGFRDQGLKTKFYDGPVEPEFVLSEGDLIIAMTEQAPGLLGSAAFIPKNGKKYLHNQRLGKLNPYFEARDLLNYLFIFFNGPYLRECLAATCTGSTVRHTSPGRILNVPLPLPPANLISKISSFTLQKFDEMPGFIHEASVAESKSHFLKQSILKSAFEGTLL